MALDLSTLSGPVPTSDDAATPQGNFTTDTQPADAAPPADAPPAEPAKPNPEDLFSKKFSALSKREKEIRNKEAALKERVAKLEAYEKASANWKDDPVAILDYLQEHFGIGFDSIADAQIDKFKSSLPKTPDEQMAEEIKAIKSQLEAQKQAEAEALKKKQEEEERIEKENEAKYSKMLLDQITEHAKTESQTFELINTFNMQEAVIDTIRTNYEETGEMLDVPTACQYVESYLEQQLAKTPKVAKLKKIFAEDETQQVDNHQSDEPSTLSVNRMQSSNRPAPKTQTADPLDRDARIKAILARNNN
jgi:hypothetical protein